MLKVFWPTRGIKHTILYQFLTLKSGCDLYTSATYTGVNTVDLWIGTEAILIS